MISITDKASFFNAGSNTIICNNPDSVEFIDSSININGEGNIVVIEDGAKMNGCVLKINGDNSLLYLSKSKHWYYLDATVNNNTAVYFGKNCYFNGRMTVVTSERQNVFVGKDGLFSYGICIRTADPHLVYDCNTKQRLNHSASVLIGDHVWLGQAVMLLKGTQIGSGSIIGAGAVCAGKMCTPTHPLPEILQGLYAKMYFSQINVFTPGPRMSATKMKRQILMNGFIRRTKTR